MGTTMNGGVSHYLGNVILYRNLFYFQPPNVHFAL